MKLPSILLQVSDQKGMHLTATQEGGRRRTRQAQLIPRRFQRPLRLDVDHKTGISIRMAGNTTNEYNPYEKERGGNEKVCRDWEHSKG